MGERLNIGMIGAGFIGQLAHLMNYVEIKRCNVLGLAEFRPGLRAKVAARYEIPKTYATHQEMVQDPDIDAVVVVTPRAHTAPVVLDCLNAGKHVISEKPMAGNAEQGRQLVETAAAKNLHYCVGYMKRFDEGVQLAKQLLDELVASNELGPIQFVRTHCYMGNSYCNAGGHVVTDEKPDYADTGWATSPDWMPAEWQKPFAAYVNTYSHNTNLLRYLFNKTPAVEHAHLDPGSGPLAILNFGSFIASVETGATSFRGWDEVTEIFFADGRLTIKTPPALLKNVPATIELYKAGSTQQVIAPQCNWTWAFRRQAEAFVAGVLDNEETVISGKEALEDLVLIETMWRAQKKRFDASSRLTV
jgi:predicted dehydrogenase